MTGFCSNSKETDTHHLDDDSDILYLDMFTGA